MPNDDVLVTILRQTHPTLFGFVGSTKILVKLNGDLMSDLSRKIIDLTIQNNVRDKDINIVVEGVAQFVI